MDALTRVFQIEWKSSSKSIFTMASRTHFKDRVDAGKYLASLLTEFKNKPNTIVIGIPGGGAILSHEIAKELNLPEDIIVVRKVGCPER